MRVLARSEFETASVQEIVREAGMSSRSFYETFSTKEELVLALIEVASMRFLTRMGSAFDADSTPAEILGRMLEAYFEELAPAVAFDRSRLGSGVGERVEALRAASLQQLLDLVMIALETAVRTGLIERAPSRLMVEVVLMGIEGITIRYGREGRLDELPALRDPLTKSFLEMVGQGETPEGEETS